MLVRAYGWLVDQLGDGCAYLVAFVVVWSVAAALYLFLIFGPVLPWLLGPRP